MSVNVFPDEQPDFTIRVIFDKSVVQFLPANGNQLGACFGAQRLSAITGAPIPCSSDPDGGFPTANNPDPSNPFHAKCDAGTQLWWGLLKNAPPGVNACNDPALSYPVVISRNRTSRPSGFVITMCKPWPFDEKGGFG